MALGVAAVTIAIALRYLGARASIAAPSGSSLSAAGGRQAGGANGVAGASRALWLLAIAAVAAQAGMMRMQDTEAALSAGRADVARFSGDQQLRGLVAEEPAPRGRTTSLTLADVLVRNGDVWQPIGARVLVSVPHWPPHDYGEYLQLRGKLQPLAGGSATEALGRQGVLASMSYPRVSYLANPQANPLLVGVSRLRLRLAQTIDRILPEPEASTLKATVLGLRSALPKDEQQELVDTGTVHLIVISGFKLSLIAAMLQLVAGWMLRHTTARAWARFTAASAVLAAIAGYTLLTGATPSAVRAAIMAGLVVLAGLTGRPRDQLAALAIAVVAIVGRQPMELLDAGLQLSSLSVLGILLLAEPFAQRLWSLFAWLPEAGLAGGFGRLVSGALVEALAASLAATLFVVPVLAASFHVVSLVSPLANLLGMPLLWPIMLFGGLGAMLGAIWLPLGMALLWPAWAFTALLELVVHATASLPYAALTLEGLPASAIAAYYAALLGLTWLLAGRDVQGAPAVRTVRSRMLGWTGMSAAALIAAAAAGLNSGPPSTVRATLLAVPGQAALVQTPSGRKVLIDGGQSGSALLRQLGQLLPPWDRGLDLLLVTTPRTDHVGGLEDLLARYDVGAVIEPEVAAPSATFRRLQARIQPLHGEAVDLGDGATLRRIADGWRLEQGATALVIADRSYRITAPDGDWQVLPMVAGASSDDAIKLADVGNVTVTFGRETD